VPPPGELHWNNNVVLDSRPLAPCHENNAVQKTKIACHVTGNMHKNVVWFSSYAIGQTDILITLFRTPLGAKSQHNSEYSFGRQAAAVYTMCIVGIMECLDAARLAAELAILFAEYLRHSITPRVFVTVLTTFTRTTHRKRVTYNGNNLQVNLDWTSFLFDRDCGDWWCKACVEQLGGCL